MATHTHLDTSQVLELRQYTLHAGKREALIELFERAFVEPQEDAGMRVIGTFRDLDAADRFVWLRGFPDLATRAERLGAFYGGKAWQDHRDAANATMIDSDDVLLLRPLDEESGFLLQALRAAVPAAIAAGPAATAAPDHGFVLATVYLLRGPADDGFVRWFNTHAAPVLAASGAPPLARLRTEYGKNEFPRLPVRDGEHAFAWFTTFASQAAYEQHRAALARSAWGRIVEPELVGRWAAPPQVLRLAPTARSLLRHTEPLGFTLLRRGDVHDFDFLAGSWRVVNRRLAARGAACTEWVEFPGDMRVALHLGGVANVDEIVFTTEGWAGMTVRCFRLGDRQWTIRWVSSRTGTMDIGVVGGFEGGRGEFYGIDDDAGRPVQVRFLWSRLGPDAARWEQAFSYDGGPWETNWVMEMARAGTEPVGT
jgi:hypothetical protein